MKHGRPSLRQDEQGFASIVIALILIIVLALLTIGFAQLARREQTNSLSRQLAVQANYAAETGINDAIQGLTTIDPATIGSGSPATYINNGNADPTNCMKVKLPSITNNNNTYAIDTNTSVGFTCLLVNLQPNNIDFSNFSSDTSKYVTFSTSPALTSLKISWGSGDGRNNYQGNGQFLPFTSNLPPVLQVSITPLSSYNRNALLTSSYTVFLYPSIAASGAVTYNPGANAPVVSGHCVNGGAYPCQATINMNSSTGPFLLVVNDLYDLSNVSITGNNGAATFNGAQAVIDVTGQAKNVLKRIQVYYPLGSTYTLPQYSVEGQSACKRQKTAPPVGSNTQGTTFTDGTGLSATLPTDPCYLQ